MCRARGGRTAAGLLPKTGRREAGRSWFDWLTTNETELPQTGRRRELQQVAALDHGEVVVIGAGVSGLSTAWRLARAGVDVVVVEKSLVGWEASGRNGGAFSSASNASKTKAAMARRNLQAWKTLDEELGYPTEYTPGAAIAAMNERDLEIFKASCRLDNERGIRSEILDVQQAREMAPLLSEEIAGMWFIPDGGHANPTAHCAGVCLGAPGPGRPRSPEHACYRHTG